MLWSFKYNNDHNAKSNGMDFFVCLCTVVRASSQAYFAIAYEFKRHCVRTGTDCIPVGAEYAGKLFYHLCFSVLYYYFIWHATVCSTINTTSTTGIRRAFVECKLIKWKKFYVFATKECSHATGVLP